MTPNRPHIIAAKLPSGDPAGARNAPNMSEADASLVRSLVELRSGVMCWLPTGNKWRDNRYAGKAVAIQDAPCGYRRIRVCGRWYSVHRVLWLLHHGRWPFLVDHINRDRADNRIENLREVTPSQNQWNTGPRIGSRSDQPGVQWRSRQNAWVAVIKAGGRRTYLGYFKDVNDAIAARRRAEIERGLPPFAGDVA